tara:strand:+ start:1317 stop:1889 length:573 start_codon:yes stop_codon:yes gene_type:complete
MTTSIVFSDLNYGTGAPVETGENDISSYNFFTTTKPLLTKGGHPHPYEDYFVDPSAAVEALQNHRFLKTRETGDRNMSPDTSGRTRRSDPTNLFEINEYTNGIDQYERYKMRRKYEILKYSNNIGNFTKKANFSNKVINSQISNNRLNNLIKSTTSCNNENIYKLGINSGIKNDKSILYLDNNIEYFSNL